MYITHNVQCDVYNVWCDVWDGGVGILITVSLQLITMGSRGQQRRGNRHHAHFAILRIKTDCCDRQSSCNFILRMKQANVFPSPGFWLEYCGYLLWHTNPPDCQCEETPRFCSAEKCHAWPRPVSGGKMSLFAWIGQHLTWEQCSTRHLPGSTAPSEC